jgi:hypothetical protein
LLAELESRDERAIKVSDITPTSEAEILCSHCLRPYPGKDQIVYYCEGCGAAHYRGQFYVCCPVDERKPFTPEDEA